MLDLATCAGRKNVTDMVVRACRQALNQATIDMWMGAKSVADNSWYLLGITLGVPAFCLTLHIVLEDFLVSTDLGLRCLLELMRLANSINHLVCQTFFKFKVLCRKLLFATVMRPFPNAPNDNSSLVKHYMYETLVEAPIAEELYCRVFFLGGCRTLCRLCLSDNLKTRPMLWLFFEQTPWALATSAIFGLIHIGHHAGRLERIALTDGDCGLEQRPNNMNERLILRREAVHILSDAMNQSLKAFCMSFIMLTPLYEQHGLRASLVAHALLNLCTMLAKIASHLVMGPRRRKRPSSGVWTHLQGYGPIFRGVDVG